eukprot:COSAG02_NODE_3340_length_6901_cov_5.132167_5_plen_69_part_00
MRNSMTIFIRYTGQTSAGKKMKRCEIENGRSGSLESHAYDLAVLPVAAGDGAPPRRQVDGAGLAALAG